MLFLHASETGMVPPEIHQHGEYRTRRLVFEAWDRIELVGEFQRLGL